jgi:hypothetical protein
MKSKKKKTQEITAEVMQCFCPGSHKAHVTLIGKERLQIPL